MKANVEFPKRAKNSFIYFQVGLIATMLVVLFVLEFNFKNESKAVAYIPTTEIFPEPTFVYNPAPATKPQELSKPVVAKVPRVAHVFKPTIDEPKKEDSNTQIATQDNPNNTNTETNTTPSDTDTGKEKIPVDNPVEPNVFSVERLPMFPACKGLSRDQQKACFDEQLAKAIVRNLMYPEVDLSDGKQGVAQVEFVIDEKGAITNVKAISNKRSTLEMQLAAEKAVKKLPKIIPAMQGDKAVKIKYSIPVVFKIR
ncbi:energy transducer TonB [Flavobacterium channae]|uniref:energy transducer TonB n=1 Tax=Flavobacterium channae TaxID=2897181 RepID=UPI001E419318|nr:energy transducer TonB [Flavobacterium channae]UGS23321.1 TonB family protein [Flavobacterium channae]